MSCKGAKGPMIIDKPHVESWCEMNAYIQRQLTLRLLSPPLGRGGRNLLQVLAIGTWPRKILSLQWLQVCCLTGSCQHEHDWESSVQHQSRGNMDLQPEWFHKFLINSVGCFSKEVVTWIEIRETFHNLVRTMLYRVHCHFETCQGGQHHFHRKYDQNFKQWSILTFFWAMTMTWPQYPEGRALHVDQYT